VSESVPDPKSPSYSTAYVARRLGVSVPTVQRWVDAGHLRAWKTIGGHRRIDAGSAEQLFRSQSLPSEGEPAAAVAPEVLKVVVVDDNPNDRDVLTALVETALPGAHVTVAENGFQGLVAIGRLAPDVVVTDIVMPKMDGFTMLEQLSSHCSVRPRVLVAASSQSPEQLAQRGTLPEGVHFLRKPVEPEDFYAMLRGAIAATATDGR
jgi:excisionase family DNA binding protein